MVNRGGVGPNLARGRAWVGLAFLVLGGAFLLKQDASYSHSRPMPPTPAQVRASFARLPMSFEPNLGQTEGEVQFLARGNGYGLYLMPARAILTLPKPSQPGVRQRASEIEMRLVGANQAAEIAGGALLPGRNNYFIGNDPSHWHRNIPQFSRVQYREVYPGIDLAFYGKQNQLEYDFELSPESDPSRIELNFKGAKDVSLASNGELVLALERGEVRFLAPHIYQKSPTGIQTIAGSFVLRGNTTVGFRVGSYDRSRALVIDPVLTFSTYLGGTGEESCSAILGASFVPHCPAIAVDSAGSVYLAGATTSAAPFSGVTPNTANTKGASENVFIAKITGINSTPALSFVTYIGGSGSKQYPVGVGADGGFNVYVAGTTDASDFPTTGSAYPGTPASSGSNHVFVSQFDISGSALVYSTYLLGNGTDTAADMKLDSQGKVYVMGTTTSSNFPTTTGALQTCPGESNGLCPAPPPSNQFFFSKLNTGLSGSSSLQYSTYVGGSSPANAVVAGGAVAVDSSFNVYLAGGTNFVDMPVVNGYSGTKQAGESLRCGLDVWAARLAAPANNTQQYTPTYETYFGDPGATGTTCPSGAGDDVAYGVASDGTSTYVTGSTTSTDITVPTTTSAYQSTNGGGTDAFVAKFGLPVTSGTSQGTVPLDYFSYLGGSGTDVGLAIVADSLGNARLTGLTNGSFPVTPTTACSSSVTANCNPLQVAEPSPGVDDAFLARLSTTGTTTTTTTNLVGYLGGSGTDIGTSIALDASLNMYVTGETSSSSGFPLKNPFPPGALSGSSDAFVTVVGPNVSGLIMPNPTPPLALPAPGAANPTVSPSQVGVGSPITFTYYIYNNGDPVPGVTFTDTLSPNSGSTSASASQGSCQSTVTSGTLICTLGTVNSSTTTTTSLNYAAKVTVTVTAPTAVLSTATFIGNSASLSFPGGSTTAVSGNAKVNDYTISATPTNATTQPSGAQFNYSVTVTPTGSGFPESVSLSCGTVPSGTSCTFAPPLGSTISSMNSGAQSRVLGIATTARVTTPASLFRRGPTYAIWLPILGVGLIGTGVSRKPRMLLGIFLSLVLGMALLQLGCGSSSSSSTTTGTPAGTYTVDVNATSGSATRTTTVQFTVQ